MEGAAARAFRKTSRMAFSDSPTYLLKTYSSIAVSQHRAARSARTHLRTLNSDEVQSSLGRESFGNEGFAATWRSIEQDAPRWFDTESPERFRMQQWPFHALLQTSLDDLLTSDVAPVDLRRLEEDLSHC